MQKQHGRSALVLGSILICFGIAACGSTTVAPKAISTTSASATYDGNSARTGYSTDTSITPSNASSLTQQWHISETTPISDQPVVANGVVYWGDWSGVMHATSLSGTPVWSTPLGTTARPPGCIYGLATLGILSTPTVGTINGKAVVWVGGGNGQMVALNAANGHIIWQTPLRTEPGDSIWSSAAYYDGSLYVGVASWQGCPQEFGRIVRLNAATGTLEKSITFASFLPARCHGPGAWSSPAVDVADNSIFIGTSNDICDSRYQDAILKLNPTSLAITSLWQVPLTQHPADSDFGATPTLFSATIGGVTRQLVGAENKNGVYYALDRTNLAAGPVWQYQAESKATFTTSLAAANANCNNTISPSSWAGPGAPIMVAGVALNGAGTGCVGTLAALNPATGQPQWQVTLAGGIEGAVTQVPGLVVVGAGRDLDVLSSSSGTTLFSYTEPVPGSGDTGLYGAPKYWFWGPPTVSGSTILAGNQDGTLRAFGL